MASHLYNFKRHMANLYFLHFAHDLIPFRWPEFLALASKNGCNFRLVSDEKHLQDRPYILIELEDSSCEDALIKSASESYLLKDLYELWAQANTLEDLVDRAERSAQFERCKAMHERTKEPFRMNCESFGSKLSQETKVEMMSKMSFVRHFNSPLNLKNPSQVYCIFEMNERQAPLAGQPSQVISKEYFFTRHLSSSSRTHVDQFSLKRRKFIANTSMDPLLSLITANTARLRNNDIVYDPFVGSGSFLVAGAHLGAYVLGADIDWQLLHGKSRPSRKGMNKREDGEGVRANMQQYNLENRYLDVMVSDISRLPFSDKFKLNAIITDPPYGLREKTERIGKRPVERPLKPEFEKVRYPTKVDCRTAELISDLLNLAVKHLIIGGRLVFYLPVTIRSTEDRFEDFLPAHPSLEMISYCDQQLTSKTHRLMVIMEKIREPIADTDEVYLPDALIQMDFRATYFNES